MLVISALGSAQAAALSVVSLNLYNRPWSREQRLLLAEAYLKGARPDIIALQESARYLGETQDTTARIAAVLGYPHEHAIVDTGALLDSGLGLVSRLSISEPSASRFQENLPLETKGLQTAMIATSAGPLAVVNVHLSSTVRPAIKDPQFEELAAVVDAFRRRAPVLVMGDFNEQHGSERVARFAAHFDAVSVYSVGWRSVGSWNDYGDACDAAGAELIDNIFVVQGPPGSPPITIVDGGVVVTPHPYPSDHCPVVARIRLGSEL